MAPEAILAFLLASAPAKRDAALTTAERQAFLVPVAAAISEAARGDDEVAALLALGRRESRFERDLVLGICSGRRCDHGRARGVWQVWNLGHCRAAYRHPAGSVASIALETDCAIRLLRGAIAPCRGWAGAFERFRTGGTCGQGDADTDGAMASVLWRLRQSGQRKKDKPHR